MKINKILTLLMIVCILVLSACGNADSSSSAPAPASQTTDVRVQEGSRDNSQATATAPQTTTAATAQTSYVLDKSGWPIMSVNVTGSKTADITVLSKGRVYYGLSISLVDPTLPG